ncbi:MAG: hypothetical protein AUJ02_06525 [Chloroflexi bacterium 13_1_40CM_3_65_12]|nr:MAG: hypothetical protein AUJ02_06525 [Chloroflexi bacterium 13_1_40CM_3_65_12]
MSAPRVEIERVDAGERVHDRVDAHRSHQLADEGMTYVELEVVGAAEVVSRFADVDADDLRDIRVLDQSLHDERSPPPRDAGDEDPPFLVCHPYLVCLRCVL